MNQNLPFQITIDTPSHFPKVLDVIHDCWFTLDEVIFSEQDGVVEIPFEWVDKENYKILSKFIFLRKIGTSVFKAVLRISNVTKLEIIDTEKIGLYDFNKIIFDSNQNRIKISTGIPVDIQMDVGDLKIEVNVSDALVKQRSCWGF